MLIFVVFGSQSFLTKAVTILQLVLVGPQRLLACLSGYTVTPDSINEVLTIRNRSRKKLLWLYSVRYKWAWNLQKRLTKGTRHTLPVPRRRPVAETSKVFRLRKTITPAQSEVQNSTKFIHQTVEKNTQALVRKLHKLLLEQSILYEELARCVNTIFRTARYARLTVWRVKQKCYIRVDDRNFSLVLHQILAATPPFKKKVCPD